MIKEQRTVIKEQSEDTPTEIACLTLFSVHFSLFFCIVLCSFALFICFSACDDGNGNGSGTITTDPALTGISAVYTQGGAVVYPATPLNSLKAGLAVTAHYSDGASQAVGDYELSGTLSIGASEITVRYKEKTAKFTVNVSDPGVTPDPVMTGISAVYTQGGAVVYPATPLDNLKEGLTVSALYSDGASQAVSGYELSGALAIGASTVTVRYQGHETSFTVYVSDPVIPGPTSPTLKIDGVLIEIPVPAEGVTAIEVEATVTNGAVTDFLDGDGVLAGKTVHLTLHAAAGQNNRINYTAITRIETAFKGKEVAVVSSDTADGAVPVFNSEIDNDSITVLIASKDVSALNPEAKVVDNIMVLYNGGTTILRVQSPMWLTGATLSSELAKIQADVGIVYADESLRLGSGYGNWRNITLSQFLNAYEKCGFDLDGTTNNFLPKTGFLDPADGLELDLKITDTAKSWDIYRLFERYHDKEKLDNLMQLTAYDITVAGLNADGLYDSNNQPLESFPYKVNGQIIGFMCQSFKAFENMYENQGNLSLPSSNYGYSVKNFATKSNLPDTVFNASGACFFQYAPVRVSSTGAVKIMQMRGAIPTMVSAEYLDISTVLENVGSVSGGATEILFHSPTAMKNSPVVLGPNGRQVLWYDIGYANDPTDSNITKFIGLTSQGFNSTYASTNNTGLYGELSLQAWTGGNPPQTKNASSMPSWTAAAFNALLTNEK